MKNAPPYAPVLPSDDPQPGMRRAAIERGRSTYAFVHAYKDDDGFEGVGLAADCPTDDEFDAGYLASLMKVEGKLLLSHLLSSVTGGGSASATGPRPTLSDVLGLARIVGNRQVMMGQPRKAASRISESFPPDLTHYNSMFGLLGKPAIVDRVDATPEVQDRAFAWQRLAGANPMLLQGIRHIPDADEAAAQCLALDAAFADHPDKEWDLLAGRMPDVFERPADDVLPGWFGVTNAHYRSVMGDDDSLERAAEERRLYIADCRDVAGLPKATWSNGELGIEWDKWIYPTLSLYAWRPEDDRTVGRLVPVAIQCEQTGENRHVWTPSDGVKWKMARTAAQCADGNVQELKYHLGRGHLVMEAAIVSCRRTMSPNHPIRILLEPHFEFTLPINDYASKNLIAPGGQVDQLFGSTLSGDLEILARGLRTFRFRDHATPDRDVEWRSVEKTPGLPEYAWRDDAMLVWDAIRQWADDYVRLYYSVDADVAADHELQAFIASFGSPDAGAIQGVDPVHTVADASWFVAAIVWCASAGHSALNYAQFPMLGYVPNVPGALYAPAPTPDTPEHELSWLEMLPPLHQAMAQIQIVYELSSVQVTTLGKYPWGWFIDDRVAPLLSRFQERLDAADLHIERRNESRFMPYPYLRPSKTGQSIFI